MIEWQSVTKCKQLQTLALLQPSQFDQVQEYLKTDPAKKMGMHAYMHYMHDCKSIMRECYA